MRENATLQIDYLENGRVIKMTWEHEVTNNDVRDAFKEINDILNASEPPMYVMVNLLKNPNFPLSATLKSAMFGPYRNPILKEWLIVGSNPIAHTIERVLASATGRTNVRWFASEDEVLAYLADRLIISEV